MSTNSIALIPARSGSKRIPNKNFKDFNGRPIIEYSVRAAIESKLFSNIYISTDLKSASQILEMPNVHILDDRPEHLANDNATLIEVLHYETKRLDQKGDNFQNICLIYPTAPLLSVNDLKKGLELLTSDKESDFSVSVCKYEHPIQRALISKDGALEFREKGNELTRTQDLETTYFDAGQFIWGKKQSILNGKNVWSGRTLPIEIPHTRAVDIDHPEDWEKAEALYKAFT